MRVIQALAWLRDDPIAPDASVNGIARSMAENPNRAEIERDPRDNINVVPAWMYPYVDAIIRRPALGDDTANERPGLRRKGHNAALDRRRAARPIFGGCGYYSYRRGFGRGDVAITSREARDRADPLLIRRFAEGQRRALEASEEEELVCDRRAIARPFHPPDCPRRRSQRSRPEGRGMSQTGFPLPPRERAREDERDPVA